MRLFVSINFDDATKEHLYRAAKALRNYSVSARISHPENLHLTLAFIGETNSSEAAKSALEAVTAEPFELTLQGYGEFFRPDGNICFAKAEGGKALTSLAKKVRQCLTAQGFDIDKKPFRAHITLARQFLPSRDFSEEIIEKCLSPQKVTVSSISLMKSERIGGKLTYTQIYKKEL